MTILTSSLIAAMTIPIGPDGRLSAQFVRLLTELIENRKVNTGPAQTVTIDGGIITVSDKFSYYSVDTEGAASSDDLDTINGGSEGDLLFIKAENAARTVVIKDGTGNIKTNGSTDLSLDNTEDLAVLHFDGATWKANLWNIGT